MTDAFTTDPVDVISRICDDGEGDKLTRISAVLGVPDEILERSKPTLTSKMVIREGSLKSNLKEPPTTPRPAPPKAQVAVSAPSSQRVTQERLKTLPEAKSSKTSSDSMELYYAEMEAARNAAEEAYFRARPQLSAAPSIAGTFRAGFERGFQKLWNERVPAPETVERPNAVETICECCTERFLTNLPGWCPKCKAMADKLTRRLIERPS